MDREKNTKEGPHGKVIGIPNIEKKNDIKNNPRKSRNCIHNNLLHSYLRASWWGCSRLRYQSRLSPSKTRLCLDLQLIKMLLHRRHND